MAGAQVIASDLAAIGIKVTPAYPQFSARQNDLISGNYDLALDNNAALASTPWSYFQRVYQLPIAKQQTAQLNWERFNSPKDWSLVQQAGTTPLADTAKLKSIYSQLEADFLQQLPQIPVWYNGAWFQGNNQYWTNYPASGTQQPGHPGHVAELPRRHDQHLRPGQPQGRPRLPRDNHPNRSQYLTRPARPVVPAGRPGRRAAGPLTQPRGVQGAPLFHQESAHIRAGLLRRRDHRLGYPAHDAG